MQLTGAALYGSRYLPEAYHTPIQRLIGAIGSARGRRQHAPGTESLLGNKRYTHDAGAFVPPWEVVQADLWGPVKIDSPDLTYKIPVGGVYHGVDGLAAQRTYGEDASDLGYYCNDAKYSKWNESKTLKYPNIDRHAPYFFSDSVNAFRSTSTADVFRGYIHGRPRDHFRNLPVAAHRGGTGAITPLPRMLESNYVPFERPGNLERPSGPERPNMGLPIYAERPSNLDEH